MGTEKKSQDNPRHLFDCQQKREYAKAANWFQTTCQFQSKLEKMIRNPSVIITESDNENRLLQKFIDERNKALKLNTKEELSELFASVMKAQRYALEIVELINSKTVTFTIMEGD